MRLRYPPRLGTAHRFGSLCGTAALLCAALAGTAARAASVVTLRNGFSITCVSQGQVAPDTLRLYLSTPDRAGQGGSYMDVTLASIATIEAVPQVSSVSPGTIVTPAAAAEPALPALLQQSGAAHNVNVALLASVVQAESAGNAHAVSRTGARGLMQLMPGTAKQLGVQDSFAPAQNVNGGSAYLDQLLTRYGNDVSLALAAYNAGPAAVDRFHGIPPYRETRLYVARVLREFNRLVRAEAVRGQAAEAAILPGAAR